MRKVEIFKTNEEYTREELEDICSILLISISSLTDNLVDGKIELLKCKDYMEFEELEKNVNCNERLLSSVKKLYNSIFRVLRNGGNSNEMSR